MSPLVVLNSEFELNKTWEVSPTLACVQTPLPPKYRYPLCGWTCVLMLASLVTVLMLASLVTILMEWFQHQGVSSVDIYLSYLTILFLVIVISITIWRSFKELSRHTRIAAIQGLEKTYCHWNKKCPSRKLSIFRFG